MFNGGGLWPVTLAADTSARLQADPLPTYAKQLTVQLVIFLLSLPSMFIHYKKKIYCSRRQSCRYADV
jgi:hypothetical protein